MVLKFDEYDFYESENEEYDFDGFCEDEELLIDDEPNLLDSLLTEVFEKPEITDVDSAIDTLLSSEEILTEEKKEEVEEGNKTEIEDFPDSLAEEAEVDLDLIPNFCTSQNVYGTTFSVSNGELERPRQISTFKRSSLWIQFSVAKSLKNFEQFLKYERLPTTVNYGSQVSFPDSKFVRLETRTAQEVESMETRNIQKLIIDSFRSGKLTVLYIGVTNNQITGCRMSNMEQDYLRLALDTALQTEFDPPIGNVLDTIDIRFIPIKNAPNNEQNLFLVVIWIKKLRRDIYRLSSNND